MYGEQIFKLFAVFIKKYPIRASSGGFKRTFCRRLDWLVHCAAAVTFAKCDLYFNCALNLHFNTLSLFSW